jgi:hypothetical protein
MAFKVSPAMELCSSGLYYPVVTESISNVCQQLTASIFSSTLKMETLWPSETQKIPTKHDIISAGQLVLPTDLLKLKYLQGNVGNLIRHETAHDILGEY